MTLTLASDSSTSAAAPPVTAADARPSAADWSDWLSPEDLTDLSSHPLLQALKKEQVSLGQMQVLLAQHSHYSRHFTRYLCALMGQLTEAADVVALLGNLREEMGVDGQGGTTHAEMFRHALSILGVHPEHHTPMPETLRMVETMMGHCSSSNPIDGLSALCLGAEAIVPTLYRPILVGLQALGYGPEVTEFFRLHIEEDESHAQTLMAILERLTQDLPHGRQRALRVGREMIALRLQMLDAVWRSTRPSALGVVHSAAAVEPNLPSAAAERGHFTSADFWRVPSRLTPMIPARLHHADVMQERDGAGGPSQGAGEQHFSQARRHRVHIVDLPSHTLSMTLGHLEPGQSTRLHRHNYETMVYVLSGRGFSRVGDRKVAWQAGDAFYVPVWAAHQHVNEGEEACTYLACENAPMLQNLGGLALREELGPAAA